jgi:hypothetical protein
LGIDDFKSLYAVTLVTGFNCITTKKMQSWPVGLYVQGIKIMQYKAAEGQ